MEDLESSSLTPGEKVLLRFVDKVNQDSPNIVAEDMAPLHEAGWNDAEIDRIIDEERAQIQPAP